MFKKNIILLLLFFSCSFSIQVFSTNKFKNFSKITIDETSRLFLIGLTKDQKFKLTELDTNNKIINTNTISFDNINYQPLEIKDFSIISDNAFVIMSLKNKKKDKNVIFTFNIHSNFANNFKIIKVGNFIENELLRYKRLNENLTAILTSSQIMLSNIYSKKIVFFSKLPEIYKKIIFPVIDITSNSERYVYLLDKIGERILKIDLVKKIILSHYKKRELFSKLYLIKRRLYAIDYMKKYIYIFDKNLKKIKRIKLRIPSKEILDIHINQNQKIIILLGKKENLDIFNKIKTISMH